jgi:uncharacterized protein (DUF983 family)
MSGCSSSKCTKGFCPGCKNGQTWCDDPRCHPYCETCHIQSDNDYNAGMVIIILIICLFAILFIVWFVYGPQLFHPHSDNSKINYIGY